MSCLHCVHLSPRRRCAMLGITVSHPDIGTCRHEEHRKDCGCDRCGRARSQEFIGTLRKLHVSKRVLEAAEKAASESATTTVPGVEEA
jgi:hypothetical protein